ncbi:unnamed protein product [Lepeophtheirus salmonis]|uniref:(salmon louse) hypothetical protein n=1 Tax=Lepeophtheirus salmonis TaxID=72036 RepID=A0A7R8CRV8_LEPSM|nr:unnamed protein product [Lepeophtheirus salmonis]CAF2910854.1 unnamed protein product [Lepeophtheirus salmonis]
MGKATLVDITLVGIAILATLALPDPDHSRGHHAVSHRGSYGHHGYGKREAEPSYDHGHAEPSIGHGHGHGGYPSGSYIHHGYGKREAEDTLAMPIQDLVITDMESGKPNCPLNMGMVVTLLEAMDIMDMASVMLNLPEDMVAIPIENLVITDMESRKPNLQEDTKATLLEAMVADTIINDILNLQPDSRVLETNIPFEIGSISA